MYDEFDNTQNDLEQGTMGGGTPEPEHVFTRTESAAQETAYEYYRKPESQETDPNGFQHYTYEQQNGTQQNPNGTALHRFHLHREKGGKKLWKSFAICTSLALVFGVVSSAAFQVTDYVGSKLLPQKTVTSLETTGSVSQKDNTKNPTPSAATAVSTAGDVSQVVKNTMPSIVAITNKGVEEVESMFFGKSYTKQTESAGSGVIISENDTELLIVTNNHVVAGAEELTVCFSVDLENPEDAVVKAQTKGTDPDHDLAVVAVNKADIPEEVRSQIKVIQTGDSNAMEIGQQVIAIGNALGYGQSVTVGYVSALDREVTVENTTNKLIQTDAAINFGNSGGALLNAAGQLIGINSAKAAASGVEGMGYAIPMATAQPILNDLMNRTTRTKVDEDVKGYLGIVPRDVSEEAKEVYNMPAGAYVYEVTEGSAAEAAGIKKGDIIVKIDGQSISSRSDLFDRMEYYKAGETIDIVVSTAQNGEYEEHTVTVTLGKKPVDDTVAPEEEQQQPSQGDGYDYFYNYGDDDSSGQFFNPFEQLIP